MKIFLWKNFNNRITVSYIVYLMQMRNLGPTHMPILLSLEFSISNDNEDFKKIKHKQNFTTITYSFNNSA